MTYFRVMVMCIPQFTMDHSSSCVFSSLIFPCLALHHRKTRHRRDASSVFVCFHSRRERWSDSASFHCSLSAGIVQLQFHLEGSAFPQCVLLSAGSPSVTSA